MAKNFSNQASSNSRQPLSRLVLQAYRIFAIRSVNMLRERGYEQINLAHTSLLANLDSEGTWITTLADRAGMTKQSMRQLVIELEAKGYVTKTIDPKDKRATLILFTSTGVQLMQDVQEIKQQMQNECLDLLGADYLQIIEEGLDKLITHFDVSVTGKQ